MNGMLADVVQCFAQLLRVSCQIIMSGMLAGALRLFCPTFAEVLCVSRWRGIAIVLQLLAGYHRDTDSRCVNILLLLHFFVFYSSSKVKCLLLPLA